MQTKTAPTAHYCIISAFSQKTLSEKPNTENNDGLQKRKQRSIANIRLNCMYHILFKEKKEEQNTVVLFHPQTVVSDPTKAPFSIHQRHHLGTLLVYGPTRYRQARSIFLTLPVNVVQHVVIGECWIARSATTKVMEWIYLMPHGAGSNSVLLFLYFVRTSSKCNVVLHIFFSLLTSIVRTEWNNVSQNWLLCFLFSDTASPMFLVNANTLSIRQLVVNGNCSQVPVDQVSSPNFWKVLFRLVGIQVQGMIESCSFHLQVSQIQFLFYQLSNTDFL